uniref:Pleckstrin homology and RhoGEF domain containing G1 n=1 Tax=Callorhinchus milii TaxID=7868 RepID=A0A4W3HFX8_CALMI
MDSSDRDRPVSYSSTSSSASSRDSHCSFSSGMTLVSNSPLGLNSQDKEAGAIKLELIPTRGLSNPEQCENNRQGNLNPVSIVEKQSTPATNTAAKRVESKGSHRNRATSPTATSATPKLLYVDRVVQEILETERTYVQDLKTIVQDYLDCITDQSRHPLGTEERSALFGNIRDIYHFNSELLQDLENCDSDPVAIAECFVAKSEEFHIYTQYCTNYPRSVAVLTECMRNKVLAKFFRERQETLKHSLPLGSYLLKPVQRILKYHLLLHEIVNHLDKDTECYDVVQDAIDTMQRVAWHINDMKRKHEHAVRLQEIQSLLTNWKGPDLTSYGELVLEGTFRIQRAKNERTLFLLDKLLLITKKREDMYTYKAHILCCNLMLVEVIPKEPLSFSVFHYKNPKVQHTVQAKSVQDKRLWILHLKRLILENHPAKIPAKVRKSKLHNHPGFHYSPEGERRAAAHVREEGITPRRVRRKSGTSLTFSASTPSAKEPCQFTTSAGSAATGALASEWIKTKGISGSVQMADPRGACAVRELWSDAPIREILFPGQPLSRRNPEDDDYQMFMPAISTPTLNSTQVSQACTESSRPCSWHTEITQENPIPAISRRIVRRANSVKENHSTFRSTMSNKKLTTTRFTEIRRRAAANKSTACPQKEVDTTKCFTQTIGLCEKNHKNVKTDFKECTEKDNFLGPDIDIGCHDNMGRFVSEESLQFSGDDAPCLLGKGYLGWVDSSSNSNSLSHESVPDKLSEEVDEIWNDLENYIKKSEETKKDRLPAAFPVSKDDLNQPDCPQENSQNSTELQDLQPTTPITDNPSITKAVKNKLTRLSGTGFKSEEGDLRRDHSALNASSSSFVADGIVTESPLSGASSHISFTSSESLDHGLDIVDRTKRRVYYMARQYSQKIKRANQLLKRNPGEQSPSDHQKQKYKDLAAILEEKKQGGPAIGARIAEYSQLYDQIVFRETALKSQNTLNDCTGEMFGLNLESPLYSGCDTERQSLSTDDWFLHSTYSNGELADFVPWPNVQELKSKYVSPEKNAQLQRKLALTGLSTIVNSPVPCSPAYPQVLTQRWSTIISPPDKENLCQEQNYNSLGRRTSAGKPQLRSQSSTIGVSRSSDSITYTCQSEGNLLRASKSSSFDRPTSMATRSVDSLAYAGAQQHFCTEALGDSHSGLILQDSQKVLVVNRIPPLDAQTATQNYFANFNDTGEDDEDYVEIKSDDDYDELDDGPHTPDMSFEPQSNAKSTPKHIAFSSTSDLHSLSAPCTPVTSDINTSESLAALTSPDKLDDYLWRVPSPTQQNIVQTLREKFQCLSSSSFA